MPQTVQVAVSNTAISFDKTYTYLVLPEFAETVHSGSVVLVPFGVHSRARTGVVIACDEVPAGPKLKAIFDVAPESASLTPELLRLVLFLRERTFCTYYDAVKAVIPYGALFKASVEEDGVTPVLKKQLTRCVESSYSVIYPMRTELKLTPKQSAAVALLSGGPKTAAELADSGIGKAVLDKLTERGVLRCDKVERVQDLYAHVPASSARPAVLTEEQQSVFEGLVPLLRDEKPHAALLRGVTGSGKTQVFIKLIAECLAMGRRALVLVPEIGLTPQMIYALKRAFGNRVAVQHSALNHTERFLQWKNIQNGGADIVVGTRSAVFAPVSNIGLIIIDEEQEHTYRSESSPRYSAHEVAKFRAAEHKALLLMASATPSVDSFYAAKAGRYELFSLDKRYSGNPLPEVSLVDMREELKAGNAGEISRELETSIRSTIADHKQAILLLNRRGYHTMAVCRDCGKVVKCSKCSVPMVYHKTEKALLCHYCGTRIAPAPTKCGECGGKLDYTGFGTQKAEEELKQLFPEARVLRMDQDSTSTKDAHEKLLTAFANHEYDILLGTQMVAKGLDFKDVTLVGVLGIDSLLFAQGYRAYETVFSLVTQVVGRSGRADTPGRAIIQTIDAENAVLNLAAKQDYLAFYEQEIVYRKLCLYPPFCAICVVGFSGLKETEVARAAARFSKLIGDAAAKQAGIPLRVMGPLPCAVSKINDRFRYKLTIKCRNDKSFRNLLREVLKQYESEDAGSHVTIAIDLHSDGDI